MEAAQALPRARWASTQRLTINFVSLDTVYGQFFGAAGPGGRIFGSANTLCIQVLFKGAT